MMKTLPLLLCAATASLSLACGGEDDELTNPFSADDAAAVSAGNALYDASAQACGSCHGSDATGSAAGPDLTGLDARSDEELYLSITVGVAPMPAYDELSDDEVWQLVTYIRSL